MPRILLLATGGTIASTAATTGGPVKANLAGETLLAGIDLPQGFEVAVESFPAAASYALRPADILAFARKLDAEWADYDGFVLTHGTDTMAQTAWGLELLLAPQKPVVITGAQRHAGQSDGDGPRNLRDAILAAGQPKLAQAGVVILFEGDLHAARHVQKTHTSRVDTFRSGDFGKLGAMDEDGLRLHALPRRHPALGCLRAPRPIGLVAAAMGMGPELLDFAITQPYAALVLQGFGRGNFPLGWSDAAGRAIAAGKPVLITSHCPQGRVSPVYGNNSGGTEMRARGAIFAGDLAANKLMILLAFLPEDAWADLASAIASYVD